MKRILFWLAILAPTATMAATTQDLETAVSRGLWNDAAEIAHELLNRNPKQNAIRVQGAYALFQRGYANSALVLLKPMSAADWKSLPAGAERMAEIVALFQKKVPLALLPARLEQLSSNQTTSGSARMKDEILFALGRAAFEKNEIENAKKSLQDVGAGSRFYAQARYLLAAMAVQKKDYSTAAVEFSRIFDPAVMSQATEFWQDVGAATGGHWGANLRMEFNADSLEENKKVGELSLLGLARSAYARKEFITALGYYARLAQESDLSPRARLEKVWVLLGLNRHEEAQKTAADLAVSDPSFEAIEARTVRALVLADAGQTKDSRAELEAFVKIYEESKKALSNYEASQVESTLPPFLTRDLRTDSRIQSLLRYQSKLKEEMVSISKEDTKLFPVYAALSSGLEPLLIQSKTLLAKLTKDHVNRRKADLEDLFVQSNLIRAETYLEDREKLRTEFQTIGTTASEDKQLEHDRRLVDLLSSAIAEVDAIIERTKENRIRLEFRQSELLWELSSAKGMLAQATKDQADSRMAEFYKARSLNIAREIAFKHPHFERHGQVLFFVGFAQTDIGQHEAGFKTLEQFVKQYPKHVHTADAYRMLGDVRFDANRFSEAEAYYKKILDFTDSAIAGYALYKIGWCAYNVKAFSKALLAFEKANVWAQEKSQSNSLLSLKREAKRDLIALYAEVGDHRKALDYFSKFFSTEIRSLLIELARELDRIGHFEKSGDLYRTVIALDPTAQDAAVYQASIVSGSYKLRRWNDVLSATQELVAKYGPQLAQPQSLDTHPAFQTETLLREAVLVQQFEATKAPTPESNARVEKLDELYLNTFAQWPTSQDPLYRHAHFLLEHEKINNAALAFKDHWTRFQETLKEPLREEALRNLIHALEKQESSNRPEQLPDPTKLTPSAAAILEYSSLYALHYSATKHARAILFLRSAILFKYLRFEDGLSLSQSLFDETPADDVGKRAFKNLRVAYYEKKDWQRTYEWATKMLASKTPGMSIYQTELKPVREEALFLWAESIKEDTKSSELFLSLTKDESMQRLKDKALYNAFVRLQRTGRTIEALAVADDLEKKYPTFENLSEVAGFRAAMYQDAGDYVRAGSLLDDFLKRPPAKATPETLWQARVNQALIQEALGNRNSAMHYYKAVLSNAPDERHAAEAKRGIERMTGGEKVQPIVTPAQWPAIEKLRLAFIKQPLTASGQLAAKIKQGGSSLEALTKRYIDLAEDKKTHPFYAHEATCALPFLYDAYSRAVAGLAQAPEFKQAEADSLKTELAKITDPLDSKSVALADQCTSASARNEHDGPLYRAILERWGWRADATLRKSAEEITAKLEKRWPSIDDSQAKQSEAELIELHHQGKGTDQTRYALGRLRYQAQKLGLARLTFVDAATKTPNSGVLLNALTALQVRQAKSLDGFIPHFEKAASTGSKAASANLAYLHLKGGRYAPALNALMSALDDDVFDDDATLEKLIKEFVRR